MAERACLENTCTERYREFESLPLRQNLPLADFDPEYFVYIQHKLREGSNAKVKFGGEK